LNAVVITLEITRTPITNTICWLNFKCVFGVKCEKHTDQPCLVLNISK